MSSVEDPYRALGVEPTASAEEIQFAFRRVIRSLHPDHSGGAQWRGPCDGRDHRQRTSDVVPELRVTWG